MIWARVPNLLPFYNIHAERIAAGMSLRDEEWEDLFYKFKDKELIPFLGAGASASNIPLGSEIALKWAQEYGYPLNDSQQLARVAQFVAIKEGDMHPKRVLSRLLRSIQPPDFRSEKFKNTPHALLADLNLPIYMTTNYDKFLETALESRGKAPVSEFCRWNKFAEAGGIASIFDRGTTYTPTVSHPLVYHLHGILEMPQSMVLTEDDYIDFSVNLSGDENVIPQAIRRILATSSLLFIGYSITDITFRIIFRGIIKYLGERYQLPSIAVMIPPTGADDDDHLKAREYLEVYTKKMFNTRIYWGNAADFSVELRGRWNEFIRQK